MITEWMSLSGLLSVATQTISSGDTSRLCDMSISKSRVISLGTTKAMNDLPLSNSAFPKSFILIFSFMNSLKPYHDLEIDAHVTIDDALSKTTQEMGELLTAINENNQPEIIKESADVLINILSVSAHMGIEIPPRAQIANANDISQLPILLAEWHRHIAAFRNKYSRDTADKAKLTELTQQLVSIILPLTKLS